MPCHPFQTPSLFPERLGALFGIKISILFHMVTFRLRPEIEFPRKSGYDMELSRKSVDSGKRTRLLCIVHEQKNISEEFEGR